MKILIVDDDPDVRTVLRQIVEHQGHEAVEAGNGLEALESAAKHRPDAIISDGLMPTMDGFQFLRAVKQDETLSRVPFVLYTAVYIGDKEQKLARSLGADGFIVKPKAPDGFWKEFTAALEARKSKKKQAVQARLPESEEEHLKNYGEIVAAKLEEKVREQERIITEHRLMEENIRNAADEWRKTFDAMSDPVALLDKEGKILRCNRAMAAFVGQEFQEIIGRHCREILHGAVDSAEGCPFVIARRTHKRESLVLPLGDQWFEISAEPYFDNSGEFIGAVHIMKDITERKHAEEQIFQAKQNWEFTFNSITDMVTVHDKDYNIILANKAAEKILGLPLLKKVKDTKCFRYYHGTGAPPEGCPSCNCLQTGAPALFEIFEPHLNRFIEIRAIPRFDSNNQLIGLIHVVRDITERKKLERQIEEYASHLETQVWERTRQLEETNYELQTVNKEVELRREEAESGSRSKSEFLANMSHELRTPLNAVIGLSQVLLEQTFGPLNAKQSEYLDGVRQSGSHLLSLINEILDLSKIEAGKDQLEPAVFSMPDALRNAIMLLKEKAMKHGIELGQEIGPEVRLFYGDERRVKQVLFNLLSNAVKFTGQGGKVGLKAKQDGRALTITVWDTGTGIPENKRHLIFQPFQQVDSSLSRQHEGTGLGLALSKRLVEMHGGTITFESREGVGTSFTVTLPVIDAKKGDITHVHEGPRTEQPPAGATSGRRNRIMVVEDNRLNMLLASDFLKTNGFDVVEAENGELALQKAAEERPDIILLDIQMPGIDGFEVLRRLRENPVLKDIPFIAMTALAMKGDEERCMGAGFNDYISKPLDLNEMLNKINRILESGSGNE